MAREQFRFPALNRLQESLDATNVLSSEYRSIVLSWALTAVSQAVAHERAKVNRAAILDVVERLEGPWPGGASETKLHRYAAELRGALNA